MSTQTALCCLSGCGLPSVSTCGKCKVSRYCGTVHQLAHWKSVHKAECVQPIQEGAASAGAAIVQDSAKTESSGRQMSIEQNFTAPPPTKASSGSLPMKLSAGSKSTAPDPRGQYPSETLIDVHADPSLSLFKEPTRQDRKLLNCERGQLRNRLLYSHFRMRGCSARSL
jgi:hypothetical protein